MLQKPATGEISFKKSRNNSVMWKGIVVFTSLLSGANSWMHPTLPQIPHSRREQSLEISHISNIVKSPQTSHLFSTASGTDDDDEVTESKNDKKNGSSESDSAEEDEVDLKAEEAATTAIPRAATPPTPQAASPEENLLFLQTLGAITSRGEKATPQQLDAARTVVADLEEENPTMDAPKIASDLLQGTWELVFTDTKKLFRSSPFFMAGRAVCKTPDQVKQYNWFCTMHRKALAISNIGSVRQIITPTKLISEFEVEAGAVPFLNDFTPFSYSGGLPVTIDGAIVSTADLSMVNDTAFELLMDTVQIKGSNVPGLRQVLDSGLKLQSRYLGDFLENNIADYTNPRPVVRTTYISDQYRISRDMDDNIFVYAKTSESIAPTDFSNVDSDLGVAKLLEGFNDAVTKFYL